MRAYDYLYGQLLALSADFPDVTIKYAFDNDINRHIVELTPRVEYYNNRTLDDAWFSISLEFMELYPNECISFISDDSTLRIEDPEFVFSPRNIVSKDFEGIFNSILNVSIRTNYIRVFETSAPSFGNDSTMETLDSKVTFIHPAQSVNANSAFLINEENITIITEGEFPQAA